MKGYPSIRIDFTQSPVQSFQELHSQFSLDDIDQTLWGWFSSAMATSESTEKEMTHQFQLFNLIRRALYQSQRLIGTPTLENKIAFINEKLSEINETLAAQ